MSDEHYTFLDVLGNQFLTDQALYAALRFLPAHTRREIVLRHMNSNTAIHALLAAYLRAENTTRAPVNQFTFSFPLDGSPPSDWDEPVVVALTDAQMSVATEPIEGLMDHTCAICQDEMGRGTRIRRCGHSFHSLCIRTWLGRSVYCPVCRADAREGIPNTTTS
jgi:Zinc finger, C3HC4 type (RING finger)